MEEAAGVTGGFYTRSKPHGVVSLRERGCPTCFYLVSARQSGRDAGERGVQVATNRLHCSNDDDRNARGDEAVLNRGSSRLVLEKSNKL